MIEKKLDFANIIFEFTNKYRTAVLENKWLPAKQVKELAVPKAYAASEDEQGAIGKLLGLLQVQAKDKIGALEKIFELLQEVIQGKDQGDQASMPDQDTAAGPNDARATKKEGWKYQPPSASDATTKTVNGREFHWCAKCKRFTPTHSTATHTGGTTSQSSDVANLHLSLESEEWESPSAWCMISEYRVDPIEPYLLHPTAPTVVLQLTDQTGAKATSYTFHDLWDSDHRIISTSSLLQAYPTEFINAAIAEAAEDRLAYEAKQREDARDTIQSNANKTSILNAVNFIQPPLPFDVPPPRAPIPFVSDAVPQREERHVSDLSNPRESSSVQREPFQREPFQREQIAPRPAIPTVPPSPAPSPNPTLRRSSRITRAPQWLSKAAVQEPIALVAIRSDLSAASVQEITQLEAHGTWHEVSHLQPTIALSTAESEYIALSQCMRMILPIRELLLEIIRNVDAPSRYHFIREHVKSGEVKSGEVLCVSIGSVDQRVDYLTKGLVPDVFERCRRLNQGW